MTRFILLFSPIFAICACSTSTPGYHWGNYREISRQYIVDQDLIKYRKSMRKILDEKEEDRVLPPGLYAEYGFILLKTGKPVQARRYFELEQIKWPESRPLMEYLLGETYRIQD